ncbi:MAG: T9SS type A sorting domain-containing protein [Bacteroidetes bacterium]|nr:T9SS type A sorting domain-containing protein [Bacteroidota bacterium]MBL7104559.1 T9SS type A sorting domain-containing protein [Bacteroidales bacterium]
MKKSTFLFNLLFLIPAISLAQWSSDPSENTPIAIASGDQAIPKIVTAESGTSYVSWFSNENSNYNVRLQKLDVYGNKLWADEGLLISDHPAMTWLTDWDLAIDQEEYAIVTFQDIRTGNNNIYAYRISPDGEFIWGEDGLELSNSTAFDVSPKVTVTNAGNAIIAWASGDVVILQKISPDGILQWGANGITLSGSNTFSWPQLLPVGDDDVILKYFEDSGPPYAPTRHVFAQRYDADGNTVWLQTTVISDAGGISAWTQVFPFISDGNDGFYIAWHDDRDNNMLASIFVQYIGSDGQILFADDGIEASVMPNRNHFYAELALPPGSDDVFVFWNEMDANQNDRGIYGQKISSSGERLWTDNGKSFIEISSTNVYPVAARNSETDMIVIYEEYFNAMDTGIKAMRIDTDGNYVWTEEKITMSSVQSEKLHCVANPFYNNQWISVWGDRRNGNGDIYGQNIQLDGTLGPVIIPGELEIFPDTLFFEENPETKQIHIINNTLDVYTITYVDEYGMYFWMVNPYPNLPYDLLSGDSLILDVYFEYITSEQITGYVYEPLNIISETDTHTVIIAINEDLLIGMNNQNTDFLQVYPNPSKSKIHFGINLEKNSSFDLNIFNSLGERIKTFTEKSGKGLTCLIIWDRTNNGNNKVPAGTYYYRIFSDEFQESGKIILLD